MGFVFITISLANIIICTFGVFLSFIYKTIRFIKCWQTREKTLNTNLQEDSSPILLWNSIKVGERKMKRVTFSWVAQCSFATNAAGVLHFSTEWMLQLSFPVSGEHWMWYTCPFQQELIPNIKDPHIVVHNQLCACWWSHLQIKDTVNFFFPHQEQAPLCKSLLLTGIWHEIHKVNCNRKITE